MEFLINLIGGVALLLWGVRMVRTGVNRSFGSGLRRVISRSTGNRFSAFLAGLGVTAILQSSTATALIVSSFAGRAIIPAAMSLAFMLGADVGSTLVVQVLSFDVAWLSPLLIAGGVFGFLSSEISARRNLSRAVLGLGLILLSLKLITAVSAPLREAEALTVVLSTLVDEPLLAVLIVAVITWLAHSSVTIVLLVMSFAAVQTIAIQLAFAMVLGANLGAAITAVVITLRAPVLARRVPLGNLIMRAAGVLVLVPLLPWLQPYVAEFGADPARMVANFHTGVNLALAVVFLPLLAPVAKAAARLLPEVETVASRPGQPRYLDTNALDTPAVALAAAVRETLHMGDELRDMLAKAAAAFRDDDNQLVKEVSAADDVVDDLHEAIKIYLTQLSTAELDREESERCIEILSFTTNLEHIGDVIDKNLMELASKKIKSKSSFSPEGQQELESYHERVVANLDLAMNVFLTREKALARQMLREKAEMRDLERSLVDQHFARVAAGRAESVESSSLHLDVLRDLKRVNSYLTSVAYPILERSGELAESRLVEDHALDQN